MGQETNREHFFGDRLISDTVMLLTYDGHPREECRKFKEKLRKMSHKEFMEWLKSQYDGEFNW